MDSPFFSLFFLHANALVKNVVFEFILIIPQSAHQHQWQCVMLSDIMDFMSSFSFSRVDAQELVMWHHSLICELLLWSTEFNILFSAMLLFFFKPYLKEQGVRPWKLSITLISTILVCNICVKCMILLYLMTQRSYPHETGGIEKLIVRHFEYVTSDLTHDHLLAVKWGQSSPKTRLNSGVNVSFVSSPFSSRRRRKTLHSSPATVRATSLAPDAVFCDAAARGGTTSSVYP